MRESDVSSGAEGRGRRVRRGILAAVALVGALALTGCVGGSHGSAHEHPSASGRVHSPSSARSATPAPSPSPTPTPTPDALAALTLQQRVGQLFMVGTPASGVDGNAMAAIRDRDVGNLFLSGRSHAGVAATAALVAQFQSAAAPTTGGVGMLVATDQEGGEVQVLQGPGFSQMPSGLAQGALAPGQLQQSAATWGAQLHAAGVNMDLAPVVDLIPSPTAAPGNAPIGAFQREYGFTPAGIVASANAFRAGLASAGVASTIKHFPGLGAVSLNTDTHSGVTDTTTTSTSAGTDVFASEIGDGADAVMMSSAVYARIDPTTPAVFSPTVTQTVLRHQIGFTGLIVTDDMSAPVQVAAWSPGQRAVLSIEAGTDLVLVSAEPALAAQMVDAVVAKAQTDPAFAAQVDTAARQVLAYKRAHGLPTA